MRILFALITLILIAGCGKGDQGPAGPQGPQGEQGPPGESAEFVYYQGMCLDSDTYIVAVPELAGDQRPMVQVLIALTSEYAEADFWTPADEIPGVLVAIDYDVGNVGFADLAFGCYYLIIVAVPTA